MKNIFVFYIFILSFSSCSSVKESFIDIKSGEKIAGYDKDCKFVIGKTERREVSEADKKYLEFLFADDSRQNIPLGKLIAIGGGLEVATKKGIQAGDPVDKALRAYGKPKAKVIDYGKDENARVHWVFHGLFYENLTILTDDSYTKVLGVIIGRQKDFDINLQKKYIK